ncbi:YfhD family protein [Oceanobacillus luteolus]|uniref:YfhD family protein n=1 Tax=Oceanobacillus luteolus TaxID=1274358 RepID=A0ABW4HNS3_9BACI|nr:YfhD family protein [Oceanobacillus luteolus]MCM3740534.1 YfhD family protein [Oceanobacillus luteolus]
MGRDEHNKNKNSRFAQTPKQQLRESDGIDVEYSVELADTDDREAQARSKAAERRVKGK